VRIFINFLNFFFSFIYLLQKNKITNYLNKQINAKIVFDVGAYRGEFGNSFKKIKVFFFEPNIYSFNKIKKIKNNKYFNIGLGSKREKKIIYILPNDSSSTFSKSNINYRFRDRFFKFLKQKIIKKNIEIFSLNFFIKKYSIRKIDILKIDTEGYEEEVLKGISKNNFKKIKYIVIDINLNNNLDQNYFERIKKKLNENNFNFLKKFKDSLLNYEDQIYKNKKIKKILVKN